jgi:hypothetical protein
MVQIANDRGFPYRDEEQPQAAPMTDAEFEKALDILEKEEMRIRQSDVVQTSVQTLQEKLKVIDENLPRELDSALASIEMKLRMLK